MGSTSGSEDVEGGDDMLLRTYVHASVWMRDAWTRMRDEHGATAVEYALMVEIGRAHV